MNDTELEAMYVRLYGDGSSYMNMMDQATGKSQAAAAAVSQHSGQVQDFTKALQGYVETAASALGALGLKAWLQEGIHAWGEQAAAARKLGVILEVNGRDVQALTRDYEEFSSEMQRVTKLADEQVLAILAQAESFGLSGEAAKSATQAAIGLAAINDGNAQSYLRFTAAMARGDTHMMQRMARMIPQLRGIRDQTELMAKAQKLVEAGFQLAQRSAQGYGGSVQQLKNAYNDFMEDVGRITTAFLTPHVKALKEVVLWMQSWSDETKKIIVTLAVAGAAVLSVGPAMTAVQRIAIPVLMNIASGVGVVARAILLVARPLTLVSALLSALPFALPIVAGLAAAAALTSVWITKVGGLQAAWDIVKARFTAFFEYVQSTGGAAWEYVKAKAQAFVEWITPAVAAYVGAVVAWWQFLYEAGRGAFESLWDAVKWTYQQIVGDSEIVWTDVRDVIVGALVSVEFFLRNWRQTWAVASASAAYQMVRVFEIVKFFFTSTVPELLARFITALGEVFGAVVRIATDMGTVLWDAIINRRGLAGVSERLEREINTAIENVRTGYGPLPARVIGPIEAQLRQEFENSANALGEGWVQFYERRMREIGEFRFNFNAWTETDRLARHNPGTIMAESFAAATKEVHKFDAALVGSREAVYRSYEYAESLARTAHVNPSGHAAVEAAAGGVVPASAPAVAPAPAGAGAAPPPLADMRTVVERLTEIRDDARARPAVTLEGLGLA